MAKREPPNEPGKWTLIANRRERVLWRRDRWDPAPVTLFYLMDLPRQPEIFYDEAIALERLERVEAGQAGADA